MGNSDKDFEKSNQCAFDAYCKVILRNEARDAYDALMTLPGAKRKIVLLSYFGEMNDREIGDALGTGRANVQYHRSRALAMMRKTLEQESEEY